MPDLCQKLTVMRCNCRLLGCVVWCSGRARLCALLVLPKRLGVPLSGGVDVSVDADEKCDQLVACLHCKLNVSTLRICYITLNCAFHFNAVWFVVYAQQLGLHGNVQHIIARTLR